MHIFLHGLKQHKKINIIATKNDWFSRELYEIINPHCMISTLHIGIWRSPFRCFFYKNNNSIIILWDDYIYVKRFLPNFDVVLHSNLVVSIKMFFCLGANIQTNLFLGWYAPICCTMMSCETISFFLLSVPKYSSPNAHTQHLMHKDRE
jgi:hypothetical protein